MKISEMILTALLRRGLLYEARNVEADVTIPDTKVTAKVKVDHMTLKIEKEDK